jgi:outer membrane protein assembly factor BamB
VAEDGRELRVLWHVPLRSTSFGGAAAADVDGDGRLEVAFATYFGDSAVRVLNGEDGSELWRYQGGGASTQGECLDASLRFTDLDGDGALELVVPVSNSSLVLAFNARDGTQRWSYQAGQGECIDTPPAIVDVDGDGAPEITVGTFKGKLHVVRASGAGLRTLQVAGPNAAIQSGPAILDLDGDGVLDFVCADFNGEQRVRAVSGVAPEGGARPRELWRLEVGQAMYHGCSQADLDGDGRPELVIAAYDGQVYALRAKDGAVLWSARPGETYIMAPTSIGDLDGDGRPEVVATSKRVTALRADGTVLWSVAPALPAGAWGITRGVALADMDGDGGLDCVFTNGAGMLRVLRGKDGAQLYEFDAGLVHDGRCANNSHAPTVADFDGDGRLDVFFVVGGDMRDKHGRAICVTGFAGTGPGWYQFRHDQRNTGNVATPLEPALRRALPGLGD